MYLSSNNCKGIQVEIWRKVFLSFLLCTVQSTNNGCIKLRPKYWSRAGSISWVSVNKWNHPILSYPILSWSTEYDIVDCNYMNTKSTLEMQYFNFELSASSKTGAYHFCFYFFFFCFRKMLSKSHTMCLLIR